jgi:hypothetical protein
MLECNESFFYTHNNKLNFSDGNTEANHVSLKLEHIITSSKLISPCETGRTYWNKKPISSGQL